MRFYGLLLGCLLATAASAQPPSPRAYRFSYTIDTLSGRPGSIRVRFALVNQSETTLYFLHRSCAFDYGLSWDRRQWAHSPRVVCRASFPVVDTIGVGRQYEWTTFFSREKRGPMPAFTYTLQRLRAPHRPGSVAGGLPLPATDTLRLTELVAEGQR